MTGNAYFMRHKHMSIDVSFVGNASGNIAITVATGAWCCTLANKKRGLKPHFSVNMISRADYILKERSITAMSCNS